MRTRSRRHRAIAAIAGVVVSAFALASCAADRHIEIDTPPQAEASLPDETVEDLKDAVTHAMRTTGASGAIVGVWAPWSGSWVAGLGTQQPDSEAKVTADMTFRAGKVTRPMICDVLYLVAAEGGVKLSDDVARYVPGVPDLHDVSLEQLCDGTSGIGSFSEQLYSTWLGNPTRTWDPRFLASFGLGQERETEPGVSYRDSDAGYVLLGMALERATGKTAATLIHDYVAEPLDLTATALRELEGSSTLAGGESRLDDEGELDCTKMLDLTDVSTSFGFTDSGVVTDIHDLGRYSRALATGALVTDEDRFDDPLPVSERAASWYTAAGGALQAGSLVGQVGKVPGYLTAAFADSRSGLAIAVVLNNSASSASVITSLAFELAAIGSKAPATSGQTAPEAGLPWTAEQFHKAIAAAAVCTPADEE